MKSLKQSNEFTAFSNALGKVLAVSHSEMKRLLEIEKEQKKRKPKRAYSSRASRAKTNVD